MGLHDGIKALIRRDTVELAVSQTCKDTWEAGHLHARNEKPTMLAPSSWTSGLQNCEMINFYCFSHPIYIFCCGSLS